MHDYGPLSKVLMADANFKITKHGKEPLVISNAVWFMRMHSSDLAQRTCFER